MPLPGAAAPHIVLHVACHQAGDCDHDLNVAVPGTLQHQAASAFWPKQG